MTPTFDYERMKIMLGKVNKSASYEGLFDALDYFAYEFVPSLAENPDLERHRSLWCETLIYALKYAEPWESLAFYAARLLVLHFPAECVVPAVLDYLTRHPEHKILLKLDIDKSELVHHPLIVEYYST